MPRIDDYNQAAALARETLSEKNPDLMARFSGSDITRNKAGAISLTLSFLNQALRITWPNLEVFFEKTGEEIPIQQQVLVLHYLQGAWVSSGAEPTGEWISFQEVPDGRFYLDAFQRRAKNPLVQTFGEKVELMVTLAEQAYGAQTFDQGDASVLLRPLPMVPVVLILWKGDEEFPPEGNILFDQTIIRILSAEDIAWLAGTVVYPLIGMAKQGH
ncbi:MAG: DUF3786 domain-containing protein [Deltaproteobacteria bacterium]|nr:DUF3786 domain-containing protein [Deltaproteobacteria bacterium]